MIDGDDILVLLDRLRADGYAIGVREYITAQEIAAAFLEADSVDPTQLRNWLAPVLCTSADQQRIFYQRFAAWWLETVPEPALKEAPPPVVETEIDEDVRRIRPWKWRVVTALALVLVVPAIMYVIELLKPEPKPDPDPDPDPIVACESAPAESGPATGDDSGSAASKISVPDLAGMPLQDARRELDSARLTAGRVIPNVNESVEKDQVLRTNPQPGTQVDECSPVNLYVSTGILKTTLTVSGRAVDIEGKSVPRARISITGALPVPTVLSDDDGAFGFDIAPTEDASIGTSHPDYLAPQSLALPEEPGELNVRVELKPLAEGWLGSLTEHRPEVRAGLFTVPLILTFGWWRWKRYRRRLILERREVRGARSLAAVKIPEPPHGLFRDPTSVRARIEARRRLRLGDGDLDAEATVDETIRKLGWFSPVYRSRLVLPSYLALIDRSSFRDQQARLIDEFLDRLVEGGVHVDRYYFNRDPRICAAAADDRINQRSLRELAARYSESILVLCSDGVGLTDPLTGRLDKWTELLEAWPSRSLMTPVPPFHWSSRELEIAGSGFSIWPATSAGMLTFTEQMQNPEAQVVIPADWRPTFPEIIAAHPARWLERNEPDPDDVDRALRQVRAYLGRDGYRWLCSLAVYPELDWYLTLYLGLELKRSDGTPILNEESLLGIVRLPWLRHGRIPNWLRSRLVAELTREDEQAVRGFLWNLLRARLEAPDSRFKLDIARPQAQKIDRNWRRFFEDILRTEPDDSPLHDMVFVGFLLDKRPRRLQLLAPQSWRRLVYEKGIRMLGPRESVGWLIGIMFAVGLAALYSPALEALRNIQTTQGESQIVQESWTPSGTSSAPFSCWWMENKAPYNYVPSPFPADTEEQCFQLNSCGPGGGQSGGGCYKWAQCATCAATDWSTRGGSEVTPSPPEIDVPSGEDKADVKRSVPEPSLASFPMPDVIGLTVAEAERRVLSAGRRLKATSARAQIVGRQGDARPAGQIIQQLELPGTPMRPYMDDVGGTYGEVTFRVVISTGAGEYSCWWIQDKAPYDYVAAPGRVSTEERCFQLNSCGPGGGQSGGGCYKWAECATCPGVDWSSRSGVESK